MIAHCTNYSHTGAVSTVMHGVSKFPERSCVCYRATSFTGLAELVASDRTIVQADNPSNLSRYLDLAIEALDAWVDASLHHALLSTCMQVAHARVARNMCRIALPVSPNNVC